MFGSKQRRIDRLIARVEELAAQRDEALKDAATFRSAAVRVAGRNNRLTAAESRHDSDLEYMAVRLDRALRGYVAYRAAHAAEARRANQLQQRLDDACGLNRRDVLDGRHWQANRPDKPEVKA
ncbi:hypothetical protein ABZY90_19760 [Streptomyces sp. NPDC006422]|uniref:hypothetical protein n=1 Tax=unclassified Streptomyces TaxID=2593676 RepID=UPI0033A7F910